MGYQTREPSKPLSRLSVHVTGGTRPSHAALSIVHVAELLKDSPSYKTNLGDSKSQAISFLSRLPAASCRSSRTRRSAVMDTRISDGLFFMHTTGRVDCGDAVSKRVLTGVSSVISLSVDSRLAGFVSRIGELIGSCIVLIQVL